MNDEKIIQRIKTLLAMANDVSSPNEAAIAASRARHLMDKHQITRSLLDQFKQDEFGTSKSDHQLLMNLWRRWLALRVGEYNDCKVTHCQGAEGHYFEYSGYQADAIIATAMLEYLFQVIERKKDQMRYSRQIMGVGPLNSFKKGMSLEICDRLKKLTAERIEAEENTGDGKALMVMKREMVVERFGKQGKKHTATNQYDTSAYNAGRTEGAKVSLNSQVTGSTSNNRALT